MGLKYRQTQVLTSPQVGLRNKGCARNTLLPQDHSADRLVSARQYIVDLHEANPNLEAPERIQAKKALVEPDEVSNLVGDGRCTLAVVQAGGLAVSNSVEWQRAVANISA